MVNNHDTKESTVNQTTEESMNTADSKQSNNTRQDNSYQESNQEDVSILPSEDSVFLQVVNVFDDFFSLVDHYPSHVRPHESVFDGVRVFFLIGLQVMSTMITASLDRRILKCRCTEQSVKQAHWPCRFVRSVAEQSVVACSNREATCQIKSGKDDRFNPRDAVL